MYWKNGEGRPGWEPCPGLRRAFKATKAPHGRIGIEAFVALSDSCAAGAGQRTPRGEGRHGEEAKAPRFCRTAVFQRAASLGVK